ncbi:MAG: TetR/AcrR family transcriptional regulator [Clostridia bacterium]|nr:TetR/AcrR family transcriptional regulator [Clostridia bacterium]
MNRTKRRIFEISMDLFAKKGYDATSIEEITSVVGIAKGTLYYHFTSKEEILHYLMVDGLKLLEHSMELKIKKANTIEEKIYAIILVEMKVVARYENLISLIMNEVCGNEKRNKKCRECVYECVNIIENVLEVAQKNDEIIDCDIRTTAFEIFGIICSGVMLKYKSNGEMDVNIVAKQCADTIIRGIIKK